MILIPIIFVLGLAALSFLYAFGLVVVTLLGALLSLLLSPYLWVAIAIIYALYRKSERA